MTMRIILRNTDKAPIYEQIKEQIKEAILCDELKEGETLPSIRQLARDLKISVITTTRAYTDLELEGFIALQQGRGCFVLPKNSEIVREQLLRKIEDNFSAAVNSAKIAKLSRDELIAMLEFMLEEVEYEQRPGD
jgi:GntR family transcriptional regulator